MKILLTGATGFIGRQIVASLMARGHAVRCSTRDAKAARRRDPGLDWVAGDFNRDVAGDWLPRLAGVDAVVNCVGVLQDGGRDSLRRSHVDGAAALFAACEQSGVLRVIHMSAVGADPAAGTGYAQTKFAGEEALRATSLDWVILRPSLVIGPNVYGGTAMLRTLAGVPGVTPIVQPDALFQPVGVEELAETVARFLPPSMPGRVTLDVAGPHPMTLTEIVRACRTWLGFGRTRFVRIPGVMEAALFAFGDGLGRLGVQTALRTTSRRQMAFGVAADPGPWIAATGIVPRSLGQIFLERPATVQDRWHARLSAAKPVLIAGFAAYWIASGVIALGPGFAGAVDLMRSAGFAGLSAPLAIATALLDIVLGLWLLLAARKRLCLLLMLALTLAYIAGTVLLAPALLADPLGAGLKTILALFPIIILLAISAER